VRELMRRRGGGRQVPEEAMACPEQYSGAGTEAGLKEKVTCG
jgi:hypothetical protein